MNDKKRRKRKHEGDSSSTDSEDERKSRKTPRKASEKQQVNEKRRREESRHGKLKNVESSSTSDGSSKSSDESDHARKKKKRKEKAKKRKEKRKRKREKKEKKRKRRKAREDEKAAVESIEKGISTNTDRTPAVETSREPQPGSEAVPKKRPMVPMTKEEYEKQQAQVKRVYDPETGRHRLVKGTGEILEEIVSRDRHKAINKTATQGDGAFFQTNLGLKDR